MIVGLSDRSAEKVVRRLLLLLPAVATAKPNIRMSATRQRREEYPRRCDNCQIPADCYFVLPGAMPEGRHLRLRPYQELASLVLEPTYSALAQ